MKILELFGGVGTQTQALKNIGIPHERTLCEIDKFASESYMRLHGDTTNLGDICKIERLDKYDLWTYSFPCQDLSVAGKQAGIHEGTRSGLLLEVERLLTDAVQQDNQPKYLLLENVKALAGPKFREDFDKWLNKLVELGYTNYWKVLNSKDYGVPQNRERLFVVSIFGKHEPYEFPKPVELKRSLKDCLEETVDEKYYLSNLVQERFKFRPQGESIIGTTVPSTRSIGQKDVVYRTNNMIGTLLASDYKQPKQIIDYSFPTKEITVEHSNKTQDSWLTNPYDIKKVTVNYKITIDKEEGLDYNIVNKIVVLGDIIQKHEASGRCYWQLGISPTLMTKGDIRIVDEDNVDEYHELETMDKKPFRIRRLTPREYWRLMGWKDEEFDKVKELSDSQLYKQAGNAIVIPVLEAIFRNLFKKG